MDFLIAMISATLGAALFGGGFLAGWKAHGAMSQAKEASAESPDERERLRAESENEAFQKLMAYSVETAYGLNRQERIAT